MTPDLYAAIRSRLKAILAHTGPEALFAVALDCARFVLPLYRAEIDDDRLGRGLGSNRTPEDIRLAHLAGVELMDRLTPYDSAYHAAAAAVIALKIPGVDPRPDGGVVGAMKCVHFAGEAVRLALAAASAQERLELRISLAGESSFEAFVLRRLEAGCGLTPGNGRETRHDR